MKKGATPDNNNNFVDESHKIKKVVIAEVSSNNTLHRSNESLEYPE